MSDGALDVPEKMSRYLEAAAVLCDELADVVLVGDGLPALPEDDASVWIHLDRMFFEDQFDSREPSACLIMTANAFLAEAAHELRAIAALLRAGAIVGALGPLVRAIVERVGVIAWLLDVEHADPLERGWRGVLYTLVCYKEYRMAIERLGATTSVRNEIAADHRQLRARALEWFAPDVDTEKPDDSTNWSRGGSRYPTLTDFAVAAMPVSFDLRSRRGMYGAECGMTHPNILVIQEHIEYPENDRWEFRHRAVDVDKQVRIAFVALIQGALFWGRYCSFESDFRALEALTADIADRFEAVSGMIPEEG